MNMIYSYGPMLGGRLQKYVRGRKAGMDGTTRGAGWGADFMERFERFIGSGKLLRGCLLCYSYELFSGRAPDEGVISAAMALELVHGGLLIHDDIMDGDELRRGKPSMHEQYRAAAIRQDLVTPDRFGIGAAMTGGDAALIMAFELLGRTQAAYPGSQAYRLFADQLLKTCAGQIQDLYLATAAELPSKQVIYDLMRGKTASYTMALPLIMGAALAGQSPAVIKRLQAIGMDGGIIFQIRDDELGVFGDPAKTGKPVGADIKEGKKTLLHHYLFKSCTAAERRAMASVFGNPDATGNDIGEVRRLARRHKVPAQLASEVARLRAKAYSGITRLPVSPAGRQELRSLISFCARRQF